LYPDAVWGGEWGQSRDGCIQWSTREWEVMGFFVLIGLNGVCFEQKGIRLVREKLTVFPYGQYVARNACSLAFRRNRFEIEIGVYEKFAKYSSGFMQKSRQAAMPSTSIQCLNKLIYKPSARG